MATELAPGVFTATFAKLAARSRATGAAALTSIAVAVRDEARRKLTAQSHPYGTKTPASPGGPPARISGTLAAAMGYTKPAQTGEGMECRVGVQAGFTPPYGRTPASRYGYYQETGLRNGATYPFLHPAFETVVGSGDKIGAYFAADWART